MQDTRPAPPVAGALRLEDWGVIRARGEDAARFLHSQLTQDIEHLGAADARLAGYCSPKGRLLASFVVWQGTGGELLLACSADLLAPTLKRLSMFVLRAKCRLDDASGEFALWGLAGEAAARWLGDAAPPAPWQVRAAGAGQAIRLPDGDGVPRWLWAAPAAAPAPALPALAAEDWRALEVASGVVRIVAATAEQFVPQMVNFEIVGGVDFRKGCYPGQEVVARSQYRGTVKRRLVRVEAEAALQPGQEVFHSADPGQPAGLVALAAAPAGAPAGALVELKLAALEGGELSAGGAPLRPTTLPYTLPADAA